MLLLILSAYIITSCNKFVVFAKRIEDQKFQINVQLKHQYDLIPNLIETASAYAKLTSTLHRFVAVSESYPELKANANSMQSQNELSQTEDKIAKTRQFYNDTVLKYNNCIQLFPANIVVKIF